MPTVTLPTLRSFIGLLTSRKTSTTSTNRSLYSLTGGATANDQAVEDVVNALVTAVDAMPEETIVRGKASLTTELISYSTTTAGTESAWEFDVGSGLSASYLFDFDITAVADDGADHSAYKLFYAVRWTGAAASQLAAPHAVLTDETDAAASACTADLSSTTVRLRVGGTADWRYGGCVRITKTEF